MTWLLLASVTGLLLATSGHVIELDDSFPEKKGEMPWLLKFYAPWCGHCKKLEPVYEEVALELKRSVPNVLVGAIDATKYGAVTSQYDIRGYPTIKFIQGDKSVTHRGDRTKDNIVEFVKRAMGPTVRWVKSVGKFKEALEALQGQVVFFYVGRQEDNCDLLNSYLQIADKYSLQAYFYGGDKTVLPEAFITKEYPTVVVFKDNAHFEHLQIAESATNESLEQFISNERYPALATVTGPSLNEMTDLHKKLVIIVTESLSEKITKPSQRLRDLAKSMASQHRNKYFQHYQFVWMPDPDTATGILMGHLDLPFLFVFDPATQLYYVSNMSREQSISEQSFDKFLQDLIDGKVEAYGGTGLGQRLKRIGFEFFMTIYEVYRASAWLALIMFGIPTAVVSFMCYALCCMSTVDDGSPSEYREDSDEEGPPEYDSINSEPLDQKRKEMAYEEQEYIQPDNNSEPEDNNFNERTVDDNSFHAKAD